MTRRNDILKILAMLTMLIDHIGVLLLPQYRVLRTIGRIAFPIFAYQISEGFRYTSDRTRYASRLLIFGLIAQIPYTWLSYDATFNPFHINVILYFLYALGVLWLLEKAKEEKNLLSVIFAAAAVFMIFIPEWIAYTYDKFAFSYNSYGLLMIVLFYLLKGNWPAIIAGYIFLTFASTYQTGATYLAKYSNEWLGHKISFTEALKERNIVWQNITTYKDGLKTLEGYFFQARSIMGLGLIVLLEQFDVRIKMNKFIAYLFYPAHIALLLLVRYILVRNGIIV